MAVPWLSRRGAGGLHRRRRGALSNTTTSGSGGVHEQTDTAIPRINAARKAFEAFAEGAQPFCLAAPTIAAAGGKADIAKPLHGMGSGVLEIALPYRGNALRTVHAVQTGVGIRVVHAFQRKSTRGIKTPKHEIERVRDRRKRLKEMLR